jgi:hypothetical protein
MFNLNGIACAVFAITAVATVAAETHCPGNVASVPYRLVNQHQMIVDVSANHTGPYSFLLDTGTQMTMVDPTLASELHLAQSGDAAVASAGMNASASLTQLVSLEAGSHTVSDLKVMVYDLGNLQAAGLNIRGVLGEDFLERFDMLLDNAHRQVCLDDTGAMRTEVKGEHVPLLNLAPVADGTLLPKSLIVSVLLSDGMRPVRLKLDSGANISFLYNTPECMALGAFRGVTLQGGKGARGSFTALPLQSMKIGGVQLSRVAFVTLMGTQKDPRTSGFDGLLTMGLFRRVFINHAEHFAVLDPM